MGGALGHGEAQRNQIMHSKTSRNKKKASKKSRDDCAANKRKLHQEELGSALTRPHTNSAQ